MSEPLIVPVDKIRPNPFNTNHVAPDNEKKLDASMRRFGCFKPILVRELVDLDAEDEPVLEIIGGEHRWESAKRVGLVEVPIFNLGPISDQQAKEIMLADNQRYGTDDAIALSDLLRGMDVPIDELDDFLPLTETDIKNIFAASSIAFDDIDLPDTLAESDTTPEERVEKAAKTHTIMKFKVPVKDAERMTALIARVQQRHGYTGSDEMANAGDALVHLIFERAVGEE